MCGELEEEGSQAEEFYARFVAHAHSFLAAFDEGSAGKPADPVHAYLDSLFRKLLEAATDPAKAPDDVGGYERLAMEPLVLARLAGFMAAHQPLQEDPLRRVMEALMMGYSEGEIVLPDHDHHHHGHGHGHTH